MKSRIVAKTALVTAAALVASAAFASAAVKTGKYSSGNLGKGITDFRFTVANVHVGDRGKVKKVAASVRLNHSFTCDLAIGLVAPNNRAVTLSSNECTDTEANFGTGADNCSGKPTLFTDQAKRPISSGANPYAGPFKPEQPLAGFKGSQAKGVWKLVVYDGTQEDTGKLGCVKLKIKRRT
jgi:subtilisin-like proprotein convertase family protein